MQVHLSLQIQDGNKSARFLKTLHSSLLWKWVLIRKTCWSALQLSRHHSDAVWSHPWSLSFIRRDSCLLLARSLVQDVVSLYCCQVIPPNQSVQKPLRNCDQGLPAAAVRVSGACVFGGGKKDHPEQNVVFRFMPHLITKVPLGRICQGCCTCKLQLQTQEAVSVLLMSLQFQHGKAWVSKIPGICSSHTQRGLQVLCISCFQRPK